MIATILGIFGIIFGVMGITALGVGAIGVMSIVSLAITVIHMSTLIDKDSMKACKVKINGWKGIEIF